MPSLSVDRFNSLMSVPNYWPRFDHVPGYRPPEPVDSFDGKSSSYAEKAKAFVRAQKGASSVYGPGGGSGSSEPSPRNADGEKKSKKGKSKGNSLEFQMSEEEKMISKRRADRFKNDKPISITSKGNSKHRPIEPGTHLTDEDLANMKIIGKFYLNNM